MFVVVGLVAAAAASAARAAQEFEAVRAVMAKVERAAIVAQPAQNDTRARCAGYLPGPPRLKPQSMVRTPVALEVGAGRAVQSLLAEARVA